MNKPSYAFKKILIINTFGIGDVLFTTPLIRAIKNNISDCSISFACNKRTASFLRDNPDIDKVFVYERDEYYEIYKESKLSFAKKIYSSLQDIKKEQFDVVIDLSLNSYASFFMWFIGIKKRIGFNYKNRSPFLSDKILLCGYEGKHVIEYYSDIAKVLGIQIDDKEIILPISDENSRWAADFLKDKNVATGNKIIGIVPGGGASWGKDASYKRWSPKNYAILADKLIEKFSAKLILMGGENEKDLCAQVSNLMQGDSINACGATTIARCAALFQKCTLVILNDGGPLHMAVASGARTISLFGPVDECVYGPYPKEKHCVVTADIMCRPCYRRFRVAKCQHHNCLNSITVDAVFNEAVKML